MNSGATFSQSNNTPQGTGVGVWLSDKADIPRPGPIEGVDLHLIESAIHLETSTFRICIVAARLSDAEHMLETARGRLGPECYIIFGGSGELLPEDKLRLLGCGADDVIPLSDKDEVIFALRRAGKAVSRADHFRAEMKRHAIERDQLETALDNIPSPVFFKNRAGHYTGCNTAFEDFIGFPKAKVIGASVYEVAPPELADRYFEADEELMARGDLQVYETLVRYASGENRVVSFHKRAIKDDVTGDVTGLVGVMLDITERKRLEEKLLLAAERDHLTGVFNRRKFFELANKPLDGGRGNVRRDCMLVIDLDRFKQINDRYGHACGDAVLCHFAGILGQTISEPHIYARAGGEEFFCLLRDCDLSEAHRFADRLRRQVEDLPCQHEDISVSYRVSIGVADVGAGEQLSQAIARADEALYMAKKSGRNRVVTA